jgi:hypothetical protein
MNLEWDNLQEISVEEVENGSIDVEGDGLLIDLGEKHFSPRGTNELIKALERNDVSPSDVDVLRVESPDLGRSSRGPGDLYQRATDPQKKQEFGETEVARGLDPDYIIVAAPRKSRHGEEATIEDTVEHLESAQDTIRDVDEPVDFTGRILIENRPDSILCDGEDLDRFEEAAEELDFELLYSFDLTTEHGSELMAKGVDRIRLLTERE